MNQHLKSFILTWIILIFQSSALGNFVKRVDVQMADCEDCGLGILSSVTLKLCGNGPGFCCIAEDLDNPFVIDFGQGQLSSFTGEVLQECNNYELGSNINWETGITLYHKGSDGGQFDFVTVYTSEMIAKCFFDEFLDGTDSEVGSNCTVV